MEEKKIGYKDVFRQKEYLKMIFAALINRFGDSIDAIAYTWIVYELTGNAAWLIYLSYGKQEIKSKSDYGVVRIGNRCILHNCASLHAAVQKQSFYVRIHRYD